MDEVRRAVRAYLRRFPEADGGTSVDGDVVVARVVGGDAGHAAALRALGGERVRVVPAARSLRALVALQARIEAELGAQVRALSVDAERGVVRVVVADAAAVAAVQARYGDAVSVTA